MNTSPSSAEKSEAHEQNRIFGMDINLNNYEAFFLDYHEGKLAPPQVAELMSFLEEHPELKEMFFEFENISLTELEDIVHDIEFERKDDLKKEVLITKDEMDDLLAGAVEGVLDNEQQKILEKLLTENPNIRFHLDLYRKTIITADLSEVFEGKELLKRSVLISNDNYPEYLSAAMDNELNALEQLELERFLLANPALQHEAELFRKTRLTPDLSVVYENKEELKRRKRGGLMWWHIPAAAAGVALVVGMFYMLNKPAETGTVLVNNQKSGSSENVVKEIKSPVEEIKEEAGQTSASIAATGIPSPQVPLKVREENNHVAPLQENKEKTVVPMEDDLRDLQAPVIANNADLPQDPVEEESYIASNNQVNERIDPEDYPDLHKPVATGYNTLRDVAIGRLKTSLMKEEAEVNTAATKISKWDVVSLALRSFRKITGKSTEMRKEYDEQGEVIAYNINVGGWQFSRNK